MSSPRVRARLDRGSTCSNRAFVSIFVFVVAISRRTSILNRHGWRFEPIAFLACRISV
jgi:hypothetical protein